MQNTDPLTWTYRVHIVMFIYRVLNLYERGQGGYHAMGFDT